MADQGERAAPRFEVLGPVRAWRGDAELNLGPLQRRAALAVLVLQANKPQGRDQLITALWGPVPPVYAVNLLQKHISGLRRALDPATPARARSPLLAWTDVGYVLTIPAGHLDLDVYQQEVNRARIAREAGDLPRAAEALHAALGLWRGPVCDGLASPLLDAERDRLAEARITTVEERIEVDLALGGHRDLIAELQDLVTGHPMRERLRGLLMLALYRSGRQAEALTAYHDTRRYLGDELGVDPDQQLQHLHQQILTADPALAAPAPTTAVPARTDIDTRHRPVTAAAGMQAGGSPAAATRTLPRDIASFTGREPELAQLISTVTGAAADSRPGRPPRCWPGSPRAPSWPPARARPGRSPGCAGTCPWPSVCSPGSCTTIQPGPQQTSPPTWAPPRTGWS